VAKNLYAYDSQINARNVPKSALTAFVDVRYASRDALKIERTPRNLDPECEGS
jgi:hypothetical protein